MTFKILGYKVTIVSTKSKKKTKGFTSRRWTHDETAQAISMIKEHYTTQEIADSLGRTNASINTRVTIWKKRGIL